MMPIPARPSASGACSRNSAASSTSSSTNDGWRWSASASRHGHRLGDVAGERRHLVAQRRQSVGAVGHLDGERRALPHVGGRAPPAGIGLVDELEHDRPRVERILRHDQPHPPFDDVASGRPLARAVESTPDRVDVLAAHGAGQVEPAVVAGERLEHRAGRHRDRRTVTGQVGRPAGGEQPPSGDTVDEVGHDRRRGHIGRGGGDRRLARLQHRHRGIERSIGHRLPAGVAERREHVAGHRRLDGRHDAPSRHDGLGESGGGGEPGRGVAHAGGVATRRRRWRGAGWSGDAPEPERPVQAVEAQRHRAQHGAPGRADVERGHEPGVAGRARPGRTGKARYSHGDAMVCTPSQPQT